MGRGQVWAGTSAGTLRLFGDNVRTYIPDLAEVRTGFRQAVSIESRRVRAERPSTSKGMQAIWKPPPTPQARTASPRSHWTLGDEGARAPRVGTATLQPWLQCHVDARTPVGLGVEMLIIEEAQFAPMQFVCLPVPRPRSGA